MFSYYIQSTSGMDLILQNVTLGISKKQSIEQNGLDSPKSVATSSSSSESRKTVTFKDDCSFSLDDINITVAKVIKL